MTEYWANDLSHYRTSQVENRDIAINGVHHRFITHHTPLGIRVSNKDQKFIHDKEICLDDRGLKLFSEVMKKVMIKTQNITQQQMYGKRNITVIYF